MKKLLLIFLTFVFLFTVQAQTVQEYSDCNGTFDDGSGDNDYPNNFDRIYIIQPPGAKTIELTFEQFLVEMDYDFVYVYDGNSINAPLIGSYTNTHEPPDVITSTGKSICIRFVTDETTTFEGWRVIYKTSACGISYDSLTAYYPFNTNALDASGGGKNSLVSKAIPTNDRLGNDNNAYYFNGINSLIYLPKPLITDNTKFAVSLWFNTNGIRPVQDIYYGQALIDFRGEYNFCVSYCQADNPIYPRTVVFNIANPSASISCITPNNFIQDNTWYHVVADYGSNAMKLYINGTLVDTKTQTPPNAVCCYNNTIGKDYNMSRDRLWFYGSIDEVIIYNRSLKSTEVQSLYNFGINDRDIAALYGPIKFTHDASGNRTGRNVIRLKSALTYFTLSDSVNNEDYNPFPESKFYEDANYNIKIYPNPTHGELKVEISDFDFSKKSGIYIYNLSGSLISQKSPATGLDIIDLQNNKNGIYLMKIVLGDKTSEWTIIKE
jgi:hypothetical protein